MHVQWAPSNGKIADHRGSPCFNEERESDGGEHINLRSFVLSGAIEAPSADRLQPDTTGEGPGGRVVLRES